MVYLPFDRSWSTRIWWSWSGLFPKGSFLDWWSNRCLFRWPTIWLLFDFIPLHSLSLNSNDIVITCDYTNHKTFYICFDGEYCRVIINGFQIFHRLDIYPLMCRFPHLLDIVFFNFVPKIIPNLMLIFKILLPIFFPLY